MHFVKLTSFDHWWRNKSTYKTWMWLSSKSGRAKTRLTQLLAQPYYSLTQRRYSGGQLQDWKRGGKTGIHVLACEVTCSACPSRETNKHWQHVSASKQFLQPHPFKELPTPSISISSHPNTQETILKQKGLHMHKYLPVLTGILILANTFYYSLTVIGIMVDEYFNMWLVILGSLVAADIHKCSWICTNASGYAQTLVDMHKH